MLVGEVEQHPDDLIHQIGGRAQYRRPVVLERAGLLEAAANLGAALGQRLAQQGEHRRARRLAAVRQVHDQAGEGFLECAAAHDGAAVWDLVVGLGHAGRILQGAGGLK